MPIGMAPYWEGIGTSPPLPAPPPFLLLFLPIPSASPWQVLFIHIQSGPQRPTPLGSTTCARSPPWLRGSHPFIPAAPPLTPSALLLFDYLEGAQSSVIKTISLFFWLFQGG